MNRKPKLAIIGTVGLPAKYGGFETLVEQLCIHLQSDFEITVYCSSKFYPKAERREFLGEVRLKYLPFHANGIGSIPYDMISIIHASFTADAFLILGVSGCILLPFVKFLTKKTAYVNIDGIEWQRNKWNWLIKTFLRYSEIFAVEAAEAVITDNQVICDYLKTTYNYESWLIEYGGDQARPYAINKGSIQKYPFLKGKYAFSVCRIEPENNIHIILEAMSEQDKLPLVIVGNWEKSMYGKNLRSRYHAVRHFFLLDPIYEKIPLDRLRSNCYVYLHGHSAGGTNPSLVEAMNLQLPVIAYDVMYNRETTENEAIYFKNAPELLKAIQLVDSDVRARLSEKMKNIAARRYTWKHIAEKYRKMILPEFAGEEVPEN